VQRHAEAERILVVSHNFPILGVVCRITGTHLNDYRSFHLDPCGVTRLAYHAGHWNLTEVNGREYTRTPVPYSQNGRSAATK
jgi:broad specificity phosphatase PhoE